MPVVGVVELYAHKDIRAGTEASPSELFNLAERGKEFTVMSDVERDKTRLKITITKLGSFETTAETSRKEGETASAWALSRYIDFDRKIKAKESIKKDDVLSVTVETILT